MVEKDVAVRGWRMQGKYSTIIKENSGTCCQVYFWVSKMETVSMSWSYFCRLTYWPTADDIYPVFTFQNVNNTLARIKQTYRQVNGALDIKEYLNYNITFLFNQDSHTNTPVIFRNAPPTWTTRIYGRLGQKDVWLNVITFAAKPDVSENRNSFHGRVYLTRVPFITVVLTK